VRNEEEEGKYLENYMRTYFKILYMIVIRTESIEEASSRLIFKNFLLNTALTVLINW
jgi:hypothetical protein